MAKGKGNNTKYPKGYIEILKKKKRKKIRNTPINEAIIEQKHNDAERIL